MITIIKKKMESKKPVNEPNASELIKKPVFANRKSMIELEDDTTSITNHKPSL